MTFDLIVLGHLTHDIIVTPEKKVYDALGGVATYTSLAAAKLGAVVGVVGRIGNDFREEYIDCLQKAKIDLRGVKVEKGKTTIFENAYDEQWIRTQRLLSYLKPIQTSDVPVDYWNAKCFHFGPVFHEVSYNIIKSTHDIGILTSLDIQGYSRGFGPHQDIELIGWKEAEEILPYIDIVRCDDREAEKMTRTSYLDKAAKRLNNLGPKIVLITKGSMGSILCHDGVVEKIRTIPAEKLIDSTGVGDSYSAGFIVEYLVTKDPKRSALFASSVASFVVEGIGTTNLPTKDMVLKRLHTFL